MDKLLNVKNLETSFFSHAGEIKAVRDVSFSVKKGKVMGVVGESGSGKSITFLSVLQLLKNPGKVIGGEALFMGNDLLKMPEKQMRRIRGNSISMIFQDPMTSLNPTIKIGEQVIETILAHYSISKKAAIQKTIDLFDLVKIPSPKQRLNAYPHEFSGGMRQRVMIAMALSCDPDLLIADEPTTALDVTIQEQIIQLMKNIQQELNTAVVLITHDLGLIAETADHIIVMYGGQIMEEGNAEDIFYHPKHPYTLGLLDSVPGINLKEKKRLIPIPGSPPDMLKPPAGCPFAPRCEYAMKICEQEPPVTYSFDENRSAKCWLLHESAPLNQNYEARCRR